MEAAPGRMIRPNYIQQPDMDRTHTHWAFLLGGPVGDCDTTGWELLAVSTFALVLSGPGLTVEVTFVDASFVSTEDAALGS